MLREGDVAPDFTVPDQDGVPVTLSALRGQPATPLRRPWKPLSSCLLVPGHPAPYI